MKFMVGKEQGHEAGEGQLNDSNTSGLRNLGITGRFWD